jgi:hypothetical protein
LKPQSVKAALVPATYPESKGTGKLNNAERLELKVMAPHLSRGSSEPFIPAVVTKLDAQKESATIFPLLAVAAV